MPNLSHACPAGKGSLETRQKEKRDPNDADDAGQGGQHHQHHWGSVFPFLASHAPNDPSLVKIVSHPKLPLGLGIWGVLGNTKNASKIPPCRGDSLLERVRVLERSRDGVREGPGEKRRSVMHGLWGVGAIGATPHRGKPLEWTGSALDHGGVAGF